MNSDSAFENPGSPHLLRRRSDKNCFCQFSQLLFFFLFLLELNLFCAAIKSVRHNLRHKLCTGGRRHRRRAAGRLLPNSIQPEIIVREGGCPISALKLGLRLSAVNRDSILVKSAERRFIRGQIASTRHDRVVSPLELFAGPW